MVRRPPAQSPGVSACTQTASCCPLAVSLPTPARQALASTDLITPVPWLLSRMSHKGATDTAVSVPCSSQLTAACRPGTCPLMSLGTGSTPPGRDLTVGCGPQGVWPSTSGAPIECRFSGPAQPLERSPGLQPGALTAKLPRRVYACFNFESLARAAGVLSEDSPSVPGHTGSGQDTGVLSGGRRSPDRGPAVTAGPTGPAQKAVGGASQTSGHRQLQRLGPAFASTDAPVSWPPPPQPLRAPFPLPGTLCPQVPLKVRPRLARPRPHHSPLGKAFSDPLLSKAHIGCVSGKMRW